MYITTKQKRAAHNRKRRLERVYLGLAGLAGLPGFAGLAGFAGLEGLTGLVRLVGQRRLERMHLEGIPQ
jgi:hypothetical protein